MKVRKLDMEALKEDMNKYRDLYQYERAKKFKVSQNCIHKGLKRLDVSYKKTFKYPKENEEKRRVVKIKLIESNFLKKKRRFLKFQNSG